MSAIQLLESIATNPEAKEQFLNGKLAQELESFITENERPNIPMYCVLFPAKDKKKKDDKPSDDDKKEEIRTYLN